MAEYPNRGISVKLLSRFCPHCIREMAVTQWIKVIAALVIVACVSVAPLALAHYFVMDFDQAILVMIMSPAAIILSYGILSIVFCLIRDILKNPSQYVSLISWRNFILFLEVGTIGSLCCTLIYINGGFHDLLRKIAIAIPLIIGGIFVVIIFYFVASNIQNSIEANRAERERAVEIANLQVKRLAEHKRESLQQNQQPINKRRELEWWQSLDGKQFEKEVTALLQEYGHTAKRTPYWGDGGVDINIEDEEKKIVVQCKAHQNYISPGVVRELYGTQIHERADEGWVVTTSGYFKGAHEFAKDKPIKLITIQELMRDKRYRPRTKSPNDC